MVDELEPGPDPRKVRNPKSRRPGAPPRVDAVLRSYTEDRAFSIRRPTQGEANSVKSEITAAVYYLNKWDDRDMRVRPYVTEHYSIGGVEYTFTEKSRNTPQGWFNAAGDEFTPEQFKAKLAQAGNSDVEHYFKANFWVHPPLPRGFRQMSDGQREVAHERSAEARGVTIKKPQARRTVQARETQ